VKVKNPYSNAGQGVYTITNPEELKAFMATPVIRIALTDKGKTSLPQRGSSLVVGL
jgi:hypothetical protein